MQLSVPFGAYEDHGWFRQFGTSQLRGLRALLEPAAVECDVFLYTANGWQRSDLEQAATARYRLPDGPPALDRAAAARAVACISARTALTDPLR
jgi:hypothetical protein